MNVKELIEEVENDLELVSYLNQVPKKNKKTQASYLESLNHLAYLLYLDGQEEMAKELLDRIIQVPFEGNYNTWTFVDSSLVLLAYLEREAENQVLIYKKTPFIGNGTPSAILNRSTENLPLYY